MQTKGALGLKLVVGVQKMSREIKQRNSSSNRSPLTPPRTLREFHEHSRCLAAPCVPCPGLVPCLAACHSASSPSANPEKCSIACSCGVGVFSRRQIGRGACS